LTSNEIIYVTKEAVLGNPTTLTSHKALNCQATWIMKRKMIEERGHVMDIPAEWA